MPSKTRLSLFTFIDAFGWQLLQKHRFLDDVLQVRRPLNTVLGYSSTCIPTILTGKMPREHGHFSFFYYDPEHSPFKSYRHLAWLPKSLTRRSRVRNLISKAIQKQKQYSGYFQLYHTPFNLLPVMNYSEKKDLYQPGGMNKPVSTIFDQLRTRNIAFHLSEWRDSETNNIAAARADIEKGDVRFAYLYLPALDGILHANGTSADVVSERIEWYEQQLREILDCASRRYDEVDLHVFSDHGMADVSGECNLMADINALGLRYGVDYAAVYDSTMARFWFFNDAARAAITGVLNAEKQGEILSAGDLAGYGCDFAGDTYGELFFLMRPGVLICPSFMGEKSIAGMHGYAPEDKDSTAMYASNTDAFAMPSRLDDMCSLMLQSATA